MEDGYVFVSERGSIVSWNHDVAHREHGLTNHRIMRGQRFALCGMTMHEEGLRYVGAWDDGQPCTCDLCDEIWANMRRTAERNGVCS